MGRGPACSLASTGQDLPPHPARVRLIPVAGTCSLPLAQLPRMLPPLRIVLLLWLLLLIPSAPTLLLRFTRLFFTPGANLVREQPLYGIPEPPAHTQLVWKADAAKGAFWVGLLLYPLLQAPLTEVMTTRRNHGVKQKAGAD